ncbi:hypothetical protein [uncultured Sphingomonas sp.]|uniref:hypothetical protein n=1 Tax=uncultured Sphingomonas sp. TaxID=158754 RepID=UPI0025CC5958|nr:hypothetical protein [uncultured Sphingomonas sp.]
MTLQNQPAGQINDAEAFAAYLAANPGKTVRDWKGKDWVAFDKFYVGSGEVPFDRLDRDQVRYQADGVPARFLPRNVRQAAGRDPGMVWDEVARAYRLAPARKPRERCAAASSTSDYPTPASALSHARAATSAVSVGQGAAKV